MATELSAESLEKLKADAEQAFSSALPMTHQELVTVCAWSRLLGHHCSGFTVWCERNGEALINLPSAEMDAVIKESKVLYGG